jgi:hypothetical protein
MPNLLHSAVVIGGISTVAVGAVGGVVGPLLFFYFGRQKNLKIRDGTKMGMNLSADLKCPNCGTPPPAIRRPKNFRQFMWGGWTCGSCQKEFDKWAKPV